MAQEDHVMSMQSPTEAEAFYSYLGDALTRGEAQTPLAALYKKWRAEREFEETCAAIQAGMDDIEAGRCRPLEEVAADLRRKFGIAKP
jgi:predicted transcriptional regulator